MPTAKTKQKPKTKRKSTPANNKTTANAKSVKTFLASVDNQRRRDDCAAVVEIMAQITGEQPKMWGSSIIGFGEYHYVYDSGREGDMLMVGVSPRKQNLVMYIMPGFEDMQDLAEKLGKHKVGKSCLYVNKLEDLHLPTLKKIIKRSYQIMRKRYPS